MGTAASEKRAHCEQALNALLQTPFPREPAGQLHCLHTQKPTTWAASAMSSPPARGKAWSPTPTPRVPAALVFSHSAHQTHAKPCAPRPPSGGWAASFPVSPPPSFHTLGSRHVYRALWFNFNTRALSQGSSGSPLGTGRQSCRGLTRSRTAPGEPATAPSELGKLQLPREGIQETKPNVAPTISPGRDRLPRLVLIIRGVIAVQIHPVVIFAYLWGSPFPRALRGP